MLARICSARRWRSRTLNRGFRRGTPRASFALRRAISERMRLRSASLTGLWLVFIKQKSWFHYRKRILRGEVLRTNQRLRLRKILFFLGRRRRVFLLWRTWSLD